MAPMRGRDHDSASSPGKIFVGGLPKDTTKEKFYDYFVKYGEIVDHVIMKDSTQRPRGFGFITYADPSVVDKVIELTHVINDKKVEIKRTIPKASGPWKGTKTKKIFVGGIPPSVTEDVLKDFFSKYGKVVDHEILLDHATKRSRGFGFVIFDSEEVVDELLAKGNMIDLAGSQVEIKRAEPKRSLNPSGFAPASESRARPVADNVGRYGSFYNGYGSAFGPSSYRTPEDMTAYGPRLGDYDSYLGSGYVAPNSTGLGIYRGGPSLSYPDRSGPYGGGYPGGIGGFGHEDGFGSYPTSSYGPGTGYTPGMYGRGNFGAGSGAGGGAAGRYHPYSR